jgi:uracil-DNA glycosylase
MNVQMETSWKELLADEFRKPYFKGIADHLKTEKEQGKKIYPAGSQIFKAFNTTPVAAVKAVILGQDPYHGPGQAMGLSFSVPRGVPPPPSLMNIFKELGEDIGLQPPGHGDLTAWAERGVLLLNASLTVRAGEPMSHAKIGWHTFTNTAISRLAAERENIVFLLWGKFAQEKAALIETKKHLVLKAAHPSPLAASNGFFGCRHFSKTNHYLMERGIDPIDWSL